MNNNITEKLFLDNVSCHSMNIIRDDNISRHICFTDHGSSIYRFDLITWPGYLCITGDCGTYVFQRTHDMFEFFRPSKLSNERLLNINPGYWGEKLESIDVNGGYKEFDEDAFKERVKSDFDLFWEGTDYEIEKTECWEAIENDVLLRIDEGEHIVYAAIYEFTYKTPDGFNNFQFEDFFDGGSTDRYTFHYLWCLYAIVYGISEYDKHKHVEAA